MDEYKIKPQWRLPDEQAKSYGRPLSVTTLGLSLAVHLVLVGIVVGWLIRSAPAHPVRQAYLMAHLVDHLPGSGSGGSTATGREVRRTERAATASSRAAHGKAKELGATGSAMAHRRIARLARRRTRRVRVTVGDVVRTARPVSLSPHLAPALPGSDGIGEPLSALKRAAGGAGGKSGGGPAGHAAGSGGGFSSARAVYGDAPLPDYPEYAREMEQEGTVLLRVLVGADGTVKRVEIGKSSGFDLLDSAALEAVRNRWRFVPARRGATAVASWVLVPIRFSLRQAAANE